MVGQQWWPNRCPSPLLASSITPLSSSTTSKRLSLLPPPCCELQSSSPPLSFQRLWRFSITKPAILSPCNYAEGLGIWHSLFQRPVHTPLPMGLLHEDELFLCQIHGGTVMEGEVHWYMYYLWHCLESEISGSSRCTSRCIIYLISDETLQQSPEVCLWGVRVNDATSTTTHPSVALAFLWKKVNLKVWIVVVWITGRRILLNY